MKKTLIFLLGLAGAVGAASASNDFSYTATTSPGSNPDGTDQSSNPVQVWTIITSAGGTNGTGDNGEDGSGVYFGNPDGAGGIGGSSGNSWQMYSYQNDGVGLGGSVDATNQFAGGALSVGQTVSINFVMRATDPATGGRPAGVVGVSLLNGSADAITFYIYGGGPGYYLYTDAGSTGADAGPMSYQYQSAFNISFTVTGANTYTAIAGSDRWSGTFNGPLTGIDVFNHAGGNASDVGFNNLTIAPELAINNITPNDNTALFNATNTMRFTVNSPGASVAASGIQLILNGVNVSSNLVFAGAGTANVSVAYTNLLPNQNYAGQITVTNEAGAVVTASALFDTFRTNYFTWEADDFDFNGGQFIDNPVISTSSADSYYNTVGVSNIDELVLDYSATQPHFWRTNDDVSTSLSEDTPRAQFTSAGIPDYLVGYFNPSNWVNYTRTFPAGTYNIYGRLANGNGGLANCTLAEVTNGGGTVNQMLAPLGAFQFAARGWNDFNFIPLTDAWGNLLAITLNGKTTLRVTSGQLGGGVNMNFFMLAPGSNTPPAIANIYPDGLQPFETTNSLAFTVSSSVSTVSQGGIQVTLNGVNVSSQLAFSGSSSNWSVSLPLSRQGTYTAIVTARDAAGNSNTYTDSFDNFAQSNFQWEAVDYDFTANGVSGLFITNPVPTADVTGPEEGTFATNSYYGYPEDMVGVTVALQGTDINFNTTVPGLQDWYRADGVGNSPSGDFLRNQFVAEQVALGDTNIGPFYIGWFNGGDWLNYTRIYPTNNFFVYARLAGGAGSFSGTSLGILTSGYGTSTQATSLLGTFADANASGWTTWHWIPLRDNNGNMVIVSLGGQATLQVTSGGNLNAAFFMLVPGPSKFSVTAALVAGQLQLSFPTQIGFTYTVLMTGSLGAPNWTPVGSTITGNGAIQTVVESWSGQQEFYAVSAAQ